MSSAASSSRDHPDAARVLEFWFGDAGDAHNVKRREKHWFAAARSQDRRIREQFGALHERAQRGGLNDWTGGPATALALILLLDQFTRNLYRGTASAFANDPRALDLSRDSIDRGFDRSLNVAERVFLYMPFQHSENLEDQNRSVHLYESVVGDSPEALEAFAKKSYDYAVVHRDIIEEFGRFPHRNKALCRRSTAAERRYLAEGGRSFGQG